MIWGKTDDGKNIPLDPHPVVYEVFDLDDDGLPIIRRLDNAMTNHFQTCPKANEVKRQNAN